jgi:antitoxin component YwqK of YwqJK toxin-antitoxin module
MKNIKFFVFKHKNLSLTNSFGIFKKYYPTGQLEIETNYINDKKNG